MLVGLIGGSIAAFGAAWFWIAPFSVLTSELISSTAPLAMGVAVFYLLATCRIVGQPSGSVDVVDLVVTRRVPMGAIDDIRADAGLELVLSSGRRIGSFAYGQSLLGDVLGYPRSVAAAGRITDFIAAHRNSGPASDPARSADVETRLRAGALTTAVSLGAVLVLVALLINNL